MTLLYAEKFAKYQAPGTGGQDVSAHNDSNSSGTQWTTSGNSSQLDTINSFGRWGERVVWMDSNPLRQINIPWAAVTADNTVIVMASIWFDGRHKDGTTTTSSNVATTVAFLDAVATLAGSAIHWGVGVCPGGDIVVYQQGTEGTPPTVLTRLSGYVYPRTWHTFEVKCKMADAATGTFELKIDGVSVYTNTTADFLNATTTLGCIRLKGGGTGGVTIDEVIIADSLGSAPFNDFFGDIRLECQVPDTDGATLNWTSGNGGSRVSNIDDALGAYNLDTGTDYIFDSTLNDINLASHNSFSLTGATTIFFTKLDLLARSDTTGDSVAPMVRSNGGTSLGSTIAIGGTTVTAYRWRYRFDLQDPNNGSPIAWTLTTINAAEWGVKKL